jgi:glycosyltransferase involved in cell wall biosynthesis
MAERGIEQLVRAMPQLAAAHLVLLGSGGLAPAIRALASQLGVGDRVHLLAPVPSGKVVAYAASASIGVSPIIPSCLNYRYSLPNKLFQYMAAGIPVVASDFEQVREVVDGSDAGLTVDTTNPGAIAAALRTLLADPATRTRMGNNGRAAIASEYNWDRSAKALLGVYRSVLGAPGAGVRP